MGASLATRWAIYAALLACCGPLVAMASSPHGLTDQELLEVASIGVERRECVLAEQMLRAVQGPLRQRPEFLLTAGRTSACNGDVAEAIGYYTRFLVDRPDDGAARAELARLQATGDGSGEGVSAKPLQPVRPTSALMPPTRHACALRIVCFSQPVQSVLEPELARKRTQLWLAVTFLPLGPLLAPLLFIPVSARPAFKWKPLYRPALLS